MPNTLSYQVTAQFMDSKKKLSPYQFYCSAADANAYFDAADDAGRAATQIGTHITNAAALSLATLWTIQVSVIVDIDGRNIPVPDSAIYNHDKITVYFNAGADAYTQTIPARDEDAYVVEGRQGDIVLAPNGSVDIEAFQTSFPLVVLGKNGTAGVVTGMRVVR